MTPPLTNEVCNLKPASILFFSKLTRVCLLEKTIKQSTDNVYRFKTALTRLQEIGYIKQCVIYVCLLTLQTLDFNPSGPQCTFLQFHGIYCWYKLTKSMADNGSVFFLLKNLFLLYDIDIWTVY